jgi:oxaloacetate decarboxylase (Na+ extruding) subunit gamma
MNGLRAARRRAVEGPRSMMLEGLRLMALGMTMVFVFLAVLVLLMQGSARAVRAFDRRFPPVVEVPAAGARVEVPTADERARIAAVVAAVHAHRARRR